MSVAPSEKQIRKALLSYAEKHLEWGSFGEYMNWRGERRGSIYNIPGLGEVRIVDYHDYDSNKNYDGWSEDIWIVFEIHDKLYKATGQHSSYEGSLWEEELKVVVPKQRMVTYYEED